MADVQFCLDREWESPIGVIFAWMAEFILLRTGKLNIVVKKPKQVALVYRRRTVTLIAVYARIAINRTCRMS
jgi:hypothetical protein